MPGGAFVRKVGLFVVFDMVSLPCLLRAHVANTIPPQCTHSAAAAAAAAAAALLLLLLLLLLPPLPPLPPLLPLLLPLLLLLLLPLLLPPPSPAPRVDDPVELLRRRKRAGAALLTSLRRVPPQALPQKATGGVPLAAREELSEKPYSPSPFDLAHGDGI